MLEQALERFWISTLNEISISYRVKKGKINYIEIVKDCITVMTNEYVKLPLSDDRLIQSDVRGLPFLFPLFKDGQKPTSQQLINFVKSSQRHSKRDKDLVIACSNSGDVLYGHSDIAFWERASHNKWHLSSETRSISHTHYVSTNNVNLNEDTLECLMNYYTQFNEVLSQEIISPNDVAQILKNFRLQQEKMQLFAKQLSKATIKQFATMFTYSFFLELIARYIVPALLYNKNTVKHHNTIKLFRSLIQPIGILILQLINFDIDISSLLFTLANPIMQAFGTQLPSELFQIFEIVNLLFTGEFSEQMAERLGAHIGHLLGSSSAKILGNLCASFIIKQLPKLKTEEPSMTLKTDLVVDKKNHATLRYRK